MSERIAVILAGGGTGGHVFPALAVAQALEAVDPRVEPIFVGTSRGMEARVVPAAGYKLETLPVRHLKGTSPVGLARSLSLLPVAALRSWMLLRRVKPVAVVSVGGYAAGPVTLMASLMGIPTALMEQNAWPGMTNRLLGKVVKRCFLSLPDRSGRLPQARSVLTGNPLRRSILEARQSGPEPRDAEGRFRILITGGSGGAGPLNAALPGELRRMSDDVAAKLVVCHQAGRGRAAPVVDAYRGFAGEVEVVEFIEDMAAAYGWADLVICRSGATTLAELLAMGQPSMLIPFAGAADNHQEANAVSIVQQGAAVMVRESELGTGRVERLLRGLVRNAASLSSMGQRARTLGRPEAAESVARGLLELAGVSSPPTSPPAVDESGRVSG